jgi:hypothetical protein
MSGLHEAFDEIVADVPVYGDLDRAIEQAEQERRRRYGLLAGLAAAAAVLAVIVGVLAITRNGNDSPRPIGPTPTPTRTESPEKWADTEVAARKGYGWEVPDPLTTVQDAWFTVVAEHFDPEGGRLEPRDLGAFVWSGEGSTFAADGQIKLLTDRGPFEHGCSYLSAPPASNGTESCSTVRLAGPDGERARISRYQRLCSSWDPGRPGDDARPPPGSTYATCGDFKVAVAVERRDDLIGYLIVTGRGTTDYNPFASETMVAAAADPQLTLPEAAFVVPSNQTAASVLSDHFPGWRSSAETSLPPEPPGHASAGGKLGRNGVSMRVWPAGGDPVCGRSWLVDCFERRVFGADDPTTVFVGAWDEDDWADCCPRNSRAYSRQFVYVGPRHTVVVWVTRIVRAHAAGIGDELDARVIDLLLDARLQ